MISRARFEAASPAERRRLTVLGIAGVLFLVHYVCYSTWVIEDAAISYSFARHAASGEGFVAYLGGERVEGFSNPTWTLLLTLFDLCGLNPWAAAKLLGAAFGLATLPLAYRWASLLHAEGEDPGWAPVLPPLLLALNTQFVLWCASGLENSLFGWLLAMGCVGLLEGVRSGKVGWAGLWLGLLAISRPDGPLYAVAAGTVGGLALGFAHGPRAFFTQAARFIGLGALAPALWFAWKLPYFGWVFPNTYYAKLGEDQRFRPLGWTQLGWLYLRNYALFSAQGFLLPLYMLGQTGFKGRRGQLGFLMLGLTIGALIPGLGWLSALPFWPLTDGPTLIAGRVGLLAVAALLLPAAGLGRPGAVVRVMSWSLMLVSLFFALYAGGDWMSGWRWLSLCAVPQAILLGDGITLFANGLREWLGPRLPSVSRAQLALLLLAIPGIAGIAGSVQFLSGIETTPFMVARRVRYMQDIARRLQVEHVSLAEVDMGAHMWWSGFDLVDMAGLVDVPLAHHPYTPRLMDEYVYGERAPVFLHTHGFWATKTGLRSRPEFRNYLEIPGYAHSSRKFHVGNFVRRDLIFGARPLQPLARFEGADLDAVSLPSTTAMPGGTLYVEVSVARAPIPTNFRVLLVLAQGAHRIVHELPPAYDWAEPKAWRINESVTTRAELALPADAPLGEYQLAVVMLSEGVAGTVMPYALPPEFSPSEPLYARGELRLRQHVTLLAPPEAERRLQQQVADALTQQSPSACEQDEQAWRDARHALPATHPLRQSLQAQLYTHLAACYAPNISLDATPDAVAWGKRAIALDRHEPLSTSACHRLATQLHERAQLGHVPDATKPAQTLAQAQLADALALWPTKSAWRVEAEALRSRRLGEPIKR